MPIPKPVPALLLLFLAAPTGAQQQRMGPPQGETVRTEVRIQRIIVRVPRMDLTAASAAPALPAITWVEKRTDRCVPVANLAAVSVTRPDSVDLMLAGGKRLRARLEDDCPSLAFYSGFYVKPTSDGMMCASRDSIRSRSGGQCRISSFRMLVPSR
ncbi:hypothetical protein [Sphingomonas sp. 3-13AW]|jgi:hypothetical protein|uniref:hypothetical protein n=1 Tax=Sphingomonas sp. 3-13AW TaxID=3050450 RepID=UPI003BB71C31